MIAKITLGSLLMNVLVAQAVPVTFEFSAISNGGSYGYPSEGSPLVVPSPFSDYSWSWQAPLSGSFAIESETPALAGGTYINGEWTEIGNFYFSALRQLSVTVADRQFDFAAVQPPGTYDPDQSAVVVNDLSVPLPPINSDLYQLGANFGAGIFAGDFSHLEVRFSLLRYENDLSLMTSRDLIENVVYTPNWHAFFTIYDPVLRSDFQIHANLTSLERVDSVPEPETLALFASGFGLALLARRRRLANPERLAG